MPEEQAESRDRRGRFRKGVSGNPRGRPAGVVELSTALRRQLPPEEFAKVLAEKAREGAPWACAIVADRYWPKTTRIDGQLAAGPREGPHLEPFVSTEEAEREAEGARLPLRGATH